MQFAGMNYLAILIAAAAGFGIGALWYTLLGDAWVAAQNKTKQDFTPSPRPFIIAAICQFVMAFVLAGVIGHLGLDQVTFKNGIISAAFCWVGFVLTTMLVNHAFQGASFKLTLIDTGHWLVVLLAMGAIIGLMGV